MSGQSPNAAQTWHLNHGYVLLAVAISMLCCPSQTLDCNLKNCQSNSRCVLQFYEIDLPQASATKQKLVDRALPDAAKVFVLLPSCSLLLHE